MRDCFLTFRPVKDGVVDGEHGAHGENLSRAEVLLRLDESLAELRVERQLGHAPPQLCQLALVVERAQSVELLERADERLGRRRVHEIEVDEVVDAERFEHEHHRAEVGALDLRNRVLVQLVGERVGGVHAEALARRHSTGSPRSLSRRGAGHRSDDQTLHAGAGIVRLLFAGGGEKKTRKKQSSHRNDTRTEAVSESPECQLQ